MRFVLVALFALFWALPAISGTDTWTSRGSQVSAVRPGEVAQITASATGTTTVVGTSACNAVNIFTDDTDVTFDVQECATNSGSCRVRNDPSPLNAASVTGYGISPTVPAAVRLNIVANPPATFTLTCNP